MYHAIGKLYWIGLIYVFELLNDIFYNFNIFFLFFKLGHLPFYIIGLEVYTFPWNESIYFILESQLNGLIIL